MCIRFGSDAGRDFLSTRDPVPRRPEPSAECRGPARDGRRRSRLHEFLAGFYGRKGSDR
jgi:hypothetical protein